jgi:hypothetical protein
MTLTFETLCFRIQITGGSVWVESRSGGAWVLRMQHTLPIAEALDPLSPMSILKTAVLHFEKTHSGNTSLRTELTGVQISSVPAETKMILPVPGREGVLSRTMPITGRKSAQNSRLPLRPPLATR